jgi:hypothetical protein
MVYDENHRLLALTATQPNSRLASLRRIDLDRRRGQKLAA